MAHHTFQNYSTIPKYRYKYSTSFSYKCIDGEWVQTKSVPRKRTNRQLSHLLEKEAGWAHG